MARTNHTSAAPWRHFWQNLQARERRAVALAATVLGLYLLWAVGLAPAWRSLQSAPARHQAADAQLAEMNALAQQAQALAARRGTQALGRADAVRALEQATQQTLGAGTRLNISGNRATVSLAGTTPDALARWLAQARLNARLLPVEVTLQRSGEGATLRWNGSVVLGGPALNDAP